MKRIKKKKKKVKPIMEIIVKIIKELSKEKILIKRKTHCFYNKEINFLIFMLFETLGIHNDVTLKLLSERLRENYGIKITRQGVGKMLRSNSTCQYLGRFFEELLKATRKEISNTHFCEIISKFKEVCIEDSTLLQLKDKLKDDYPGTRRSKASLKVNIIYEMNTRSIRSFKMEIGKKPDQNIGKETIDNYNVGELVIADLGYFSQERFKKLIDKGVYFLSRYFHKTKLRINKEDSGFYLYEYIDENNDEIIDLKCFLGAKKLPIHLVGFKNTEEVYEQILKNKKKKRRKMTTELKKECRYTTFITNIEDDKFNIKKLYNLYCNRWEIELLIKEFKSFINLKDAGNCLSDNEVKSILYSRFILIIIISYLKNIAEKKVKIKGREFSSYGFVTSILNKLLLAKFMKKGNVNLLFTEERLKRYYLPKSYRSTRKQLDDTS